MKKLFIILLAACTAVCTTACSDDNTTDGSAPEVQLSVSADALMFLSTGDVAEGENGLLVTSSEPWRLSGKKTWCRPSAVEGKSGETVTFVADPNPNSESRSITYSFICGNKTSKVVVTQEPSSMLDFATSMSFNIAVEGGPISIVVKATDDMTYTIAPEYEGWIAPNISRAVQTNFLSFNISANATFAPRDGEILFSVEGKQVPVKISQAQTNKVVFPVTGYAVDPEGETLSVNYTANIDIVPDLSEYPWITLVSNQASVSLSPGVLVFEIESAKKTRLAQILIKDAAGAKTYATLLFNQVAAPVSTIAPDAVFSKWLVDQGFVTATATPDKYELTTAGLSVTNFNLAGKGIASLKGVEAFETLTTLDCSNNVLTELDLSAPSKIDKLNCENNKIRGLNLTGCQTFASMGTSASSALRITANPLENVSLADNWKISPAVSFSVAGKDKLTGKDGTKSTTLKISGKTVPRVNCGLTGTLVTVDITECPALTGGFSAGSDAGSTIKTIYITRDQEGMINSQWTKPSGAQYVVKD